MDILVVLDIVPSYSAEVDRTSTLIGTLALKHAVSVSRVFITLRDWQQGRPRSSSTHAKKPLQREARDATTSRCFMSLRRYYMNKTCARASTAVSSPCLAQLSPKPARWTPSFTRWLLDAFDKRILADYGIDAILTHDDSAQMIAQALEFLGAARHLLSPTE